MPANARPAFTVRFRKPQIQEAVQYVAAHRRISMNAFVEEAVESHLMVEAPLLKHDLSAAMDAVRTYTESDVDRAIEAFAAAEVEEDDLLRVEGVLTSGEDHFGVRAAFQDFSS